MQSGCVHEYNCKRDWAGDREAETQLKVMSQLVILIRQAIHTIQVQQTYLLLTILISQYTTLIGHFIIVFAMYI